MKNFIKITSSVLILATLGLFLSNCGKDDPSPAEKTTALLIDKPWKVQSVVVDGVDYTSLFANMTFTLTKNTYQITNGGPMWSASGTWQYKDGKADVLVMQDDKELMLTRVDKNQFDFTIPWATTTFGGGRPKTISGQHTFSFKH